MTVIEDIEVETETEDEIDIPPELDRRFKRSPSRLSFSGSVSAIVDEALAAHNRRKPVVILSPDATISKEILDGIKIGLPKQKLIHPFTLGRISVALKPIHFKGLTPEYAIIHNKIDYGFMVELKKIMRLSNFEIEEMSVFMLKEDSNRELCRKCKDLDPLDLPYGNETGYIESVPQFHQNDKNEIDYNRPILDEEENQLYVDYPEMKCEKDHRWFKGEGARRDIKGKNPILLASHLYQRMRREIQVESGVPDPAYSKNRFDRPDHLIYNRYTPDGRKMNSPEQRKASGASFYS